jgi:hypothetical protein|tara:strand:+ start:499 stop:930 length:432 start_codon:yes stop_codon:yes gene_type:complete
MKTRQTSIDCYNKIKQEGLLSKRRLEVYEALLSSAPCTSTEAIRNAKTTFGIFGVSSRFTELRDLGVIYERGEKQCSITGRNVIEWDLTDRLPVKIKNTNKTKQQKKNEALESLRNLYKKRYKKINDDTIDEWKTVADLIRSI